MADKPLVNKAHVFSRKTNSKYAFKGVGTLWPLPYILKPAHYTAALPCTICAHAEYLRCMHACKSSIYTTFAMMQGHEAICSPQTRLLARAAFDTSSLQTQNHSNECNLTPLLYLEGMERASTVWVRLTPRPLPTLSVLCGPPLHSINCFPAQHVPWKKEVQLVSTVAQRKPRGSAHLCKPCACMAFGSSMTARQCTRRSEKPRLLTP